MILGVQCLKLKFGEVDRKASNLIRPQALWNIVSDPPVKDLGMKHREKQFCKSTRVRWMFRDRTTSPEGVDSPLAWLS